jgi:hypothetical protein
MDCWRIADSPRYTGEAGARPARLVFDPVLEQGGNIDVVVRRDPAT